MAVILASIFLNLWEFSEIELKNNTILVVRINAVRMGGTVSRYLSYIFRQTTI